MKEFWDERYQSDDYVYGIKPNTFFQEVLQEQKLTGKILLPADGEGRNGVYAAKCGMEVTSFDYSAEAKNKAQRLAADNNVELNYIVGDLNEIDFDEESFDVITLIFAHFPPPLRAAYHQRLSKYLKKDGLLILEGFSREQLQLNQGKPNGNGPKNIDMLFSEESIASDFEGFEIIKLEKKEIDLNEGDFHSGLSSVVRFIGKKL